MSTAGATTRPGLTPMPVMTVGDGVHGTHRRDLLVDLTAVWSLGVRGRQPARTSGAARLRSVCQGYAGPWRRSAPVELGSSMSKAEQILAALGGDANVVDLEPCITRLRVEVSEPTWSTRRRSRRAARSASCARAASSR